MDRNLVCCGDNPQVPRLQLASTTTDCATMISNAAILALWAAVARQLWLDLFHLTMIRCRLSRSKPSYLFLFVDMVDWRCWAIRLFSLSNLLAAPDHGIRLVSLESQVRANTTIPLRNGKEMPIPRTVGGLDGCIPSRPSKLQFELMFCESSHILGIDFMAVQRPRHGQPRFENLT